MNMTNKMNAENPAEFEEWWIEHRFDTPWTKGLAMKAFLAGKRSLAIVWPKIALPPLTEIPGAREADYAYHRGYDRGREDYYTETLRLNPRINKVGESGERG